MKINIFGKELYIKKLMLFGIILPIVVVISICGYLFSRNGGQVFVDKTEENSVENTATISIKPNIDQEVSQVEENKIKVYVVGCVKHPGVVELKKGQIIEDAINAAGGARVDADLENINLAYVLNENVMLKIKSKKEAQTIRNESINKASTVSNNDQETKDKNEAGERIQIVKDSGGALADENTTQTAKDGKININTASKEELDTLSGVGEATAKKIIDYREKNGPFKTIDDIKNVSGIGDSKFNNFKDMITVK